MSAQVAHDVRAVVCRRVGLERRVALFSADQRLVEVLQQNRCEVLVDPATLDEVQAFEPEVVVAFDGLLTKGRASLEGLTRVAPRATVVCSFDVASGASRLLQGLLGGSQHAAYGEDEVRGWLERCGLVIESTDVVVMSTPTVGLAAETEARLRALLTQVNPSAIGDRLVLVATPASAPPSLTAETKREGVVSVVLVGADQPALALTASSLAHQRPMPLEVVIVSPLPLHALEAIAVPLRARVEATVSLLSRPGQTSALSSLGLERVTGRFLAFLEAGAQLDHSHLETLRTRLEQGHAAWASSAPAQPPPQRFELARWLELGAVHRERSLFDRTRLGRFSLALPDGEPNAEAMFLCRLSALFEPSYEPQPPSIDVPRTPAVDLEALEALLTTHPLVALDPLQRHLRGEQLPELGALLEARLSERNAFAGAMVGEVREAFARVRHLWNQARSEAEAERGVGRVTPGRMSPRHDE